MLQAKAIKILGVLSILAAGLCLTTKAHAFVNQDRIALSKSLTHYVMGQRYDLLGLTNRALFEYQEAVYFDKRSYLTHLRLGTAYARLNLLEEAKKELKSVHDLRPEDLQSHYLLALIYSSERDYEQAAQEYELILTMFSEAEPQNIEIYGYLGQLYYSQRKYDEAIRQYEKILGLEPDNTDVMYLVGSLYLEVDKEIQAIDILKESISIDPDHDGSLNTLGYIYAKNNDNLDEALNFVKRALAVSPGNGAYLDSLGWIYYQKGLYDEALQALLKADDVIKDPVIKDHLGDVYYKMNQVGNAIENWEFSLKLMPMQEDVQRKLNEVSNAQVKQVEAKF